MAYCFKVVSLDRVVRNGFSEMNPDDKEELNMKKFPGSRNSKDKVPEKYMGTEEKTHETSMNDRRKD